MGCAKLLRWIERHNTVFELYPYHVKTCDKYAIHVRMMIFIPMGTIGTGTQSLACSSANGLRNTFTSFEHVVAFFLAKELLEPIRPIAECLQGRLQELHVLWFHKDQ